LPRNFNFFFSNSYPITFCWPILRTYFHFRS
jgi:hypothetical protein